MTLAYVALGANLGNPERTVKAAISALHDLPGSKLLAASSLYRTAPVGLRNQPDFVNAVVSIETQLDPMGLLDALFKVETAFGRRRGIPNGPRTLDLDLLLHGASILQSGSLVLPHPRMHQRAFVLVPLVELDSSIVIPGHGRALDALRNCAAQVTQKITP